MNSFVNNPVNSSTPIKRIGLSRKRKSCSIRNDYMKQNILGDNFERKFIKQEAGITEIPIAEIISETSAHLVDDKSEKENMKETQELNNKIIEIENLYLTWRTGCKEAFLYLFDSMKKVQSENMDTEMLLRDLGIIRVVSTHFKNDSDLGFSYGSDCD